MSIALIGSNGQLGQSLSEAMNINGLVFTQYSSEDVNITNLSQVNSIEKPKLVINTAAYTSVDKAEDEEEKAFAVNKQGVKNLSLFCEKLSIPLNHISTDYVFDGMSNNPYQENDLAKPLNVYGNSKLAGELAIQEHCSKFAIIRTSWLFSTFGSNFFKTMISLSKKEEVNVINDLHGTPTDANELSAAILHLISSFIFQSNFQSRVWHFAGKERMTWFQFASIIFEEAVKNKLIRNTPIINQISSKSYPAKAIRPQNSSLNSADFENLLNFKHDDLRSCVNKAIKKISI